MSQTKEQDEMVEKLREIVIAAAEAAGLGGVIVAFLRHKKGNEKEELESRSIVAGNLDPILYIEALRLIAKDIYDKTRSKDGGRIEALVKQMSANMEASEKEEHISDVPAGTIH